MPRRQEFSEYVPEHIKAMIIAWRWVKDGQWLAPITGQKKIAKTLCLSTTDEARQAWTFFSPKHYQLTLNGRTVEDKTASTQAAQQSFVRCLFLADIALNRWDERSIITPARLVQIQEKSAELSELISGIEEKIPREPKGWRLVDDRRETTYRNGFDIQGGLAQLHRWAQDYTPPDNTLADPASSKIKRLDRLRWFARQMLNGNPAQKATSLAALTNLVFSDEPECANGGISKEIIRKGKL